ncbi:MAG: sensor histidine kinase [Proteobacteria bacterium]|nr:sensor histidine kinase [Pseudomonadota bacterium]
MHQSAFQPYWDDPDNAEHLDIRMDENLPEIHVDINFMNMTSNLVRNTLTHDGPGYVHITLRHTDERCILTVRDEGTGIPKA